MVPQHARPSYPSQNSFSATSHPLRAIAKPAAAAAWSPQERSTRFFLPPSDEQTQGRRRLTTRRCCSHTEYIHFPARKTLSPGPFELTDRRTTDSRPAAKSAAKSLPNWAAHLCACNCCTAAAPWAHCAPSGHLRFLAARSWSRRNWISVAHHFSAASLSLTAIGSTACQFMQKVASPLMWRSGQNVGRNVRAASRAETMLPAACAMSSYSGARPSALGTGKRNDSLPPRSRSCVAPNSAPASLSNDRAALARGVTHP